jgi:hypothetical protein
MYFGFNRLPNRNRGFKASRLYDVFHVYVVEHNPPGYAPVHLQTQNKNLTGVFRERLERFHDQSAGTANWPHGAAVASTLART